MTFTKPRDLLIAGAVGAVLAYLGAQLGYGALPALPTLAGSTLLVIAVAELVMGFSLRARINRKPGTRPVEGLTAARAVALAKASSLGGAIMGGLWLGLLAFLIPSWGRVVAVSHDATSSVIGLVSAAALVGAALWLEYCCRTPDDQEGPEDQDSGGDPAHRR